MAVEARVLIGHQLRDFVQLVLGEEVLRAGMAGKTAKIGVGMSDLDGPWIVASRVVPDVYW